MVAILFSKSRSRTMVSAIFIHDDDVTRRSLRAQLTVQNDIPDMPVSAGFTFPLLDPNLFSVFIFTKKEREIF